VIGVGPVDQELHLGVPAAQVPGEVRPDADDAVDFAGEHELLGQRHGSQELHVEVRGQLEAGS